MDLPSELTLGWKSSQGSEASTLLLNVEVGMWRNFARFPSYLVPNFLSKSAWISGHKWFYQCTFRNPTVHKSPTFKSWFLSPKPTLHFPRAFPGLLTVGHSNHQPDAFLKLLQRFRVKDTSGIHLTNHLELKVFQLLISLRSLGREKWQESKKQVVFFHLWSGMR